VRLDEFVVIENRVADRALTGTTERLKRPLSRAAAPLLGAKREFIDAVARKILQRRNQSARCPAG
jgi:hypothetical protein